MTSGFRETIRYSVEPGGREHHQTKECAVTGCGWIVEEHQKWGTPEQADVPEFTIEVAYKTKDHAGRSVTPGWRYIVKWKENGEQKQTRMYGYPTKEDALADARKDAAAIARTLLPVHVETFIPEI